MPHKYSVILHCICILSSDYRFREFDGRLLIQYKKMMLSAPQFFYHSLENLLHLELVEILGFSQALDELD